MKALTEKQRRFCLEFMQCGNATAAYIAAGYAANKIASHSNAYKLMQDPRIKKEIARLRELSESEKIADARELKEVLTKFVRDEDGSKSDRIRAAELLAKLQGALVNKQEVTTDLIIDVAVKDEEE